MAGAWDSLERLFEPLADWLNDGRIDIMEDTLAPYTEWLLHPNDSGNDKLIKRLLAPVVLLVVMVNIAFMVFAARNNAWLLMVGSLMVTLNSASFVYFSLTGADMEAQMIPLLIGFVVSGLMLNTQLFAFFRKAAKQKQH
eukprot:Hpha_TRINITY_DN9177_c0_g1::TRINITY_DN9177_c0_g1_i1::g.94362::m.94362